MHSINQRPPAEATPPKRKISILVEFPEPSLEAVVIQWESLRPTMLVQLKESPFEPIQFPGKRPQIPGNNEADAESRPLAIDLPLRGFIDPSSGKLFEKMAYEADILFSARSFELVQPEPDLVLPDSSLWECRAEALRALRIEDQPGLSRTVSPS